MATIRVNFVAKIQELLRSSDMQNVSVEYGYFDPTAKDNFRKSDTDDNDDINKQECVLIKYDDSNHGVIQSIAMDGLFLVLSDIVKAVNRL